MDIQQIAREMDEISDAIELFNEGKLDLYEEELDELMQERERLIKDYYKFYFPENVIPLIPKA